MDCREALMSLLPVGAAGDERLAAVEARTHMAGCPSCQAESEAMRRVWEALDAVPAPALTPSFAAATVARLREATAARRPAPPRPRLRTLGLRVGALAVAVAAGFVLARLPPSGRRAAGPARTVAVAPRAAPVGKTAPAAPPGASASLPEPLSAFVTDAVATDGGRLRAIDLVKQYYGDQGVRPPAILVHALARTLRSDRNPGVRMRAAEALARFHPTPEIRDAFILALRRDGNPAVRITAVEALARAARAFDAASIESLRERANDLGENQHLRTVVARALGTIAM